MDAQTIIAKRIARELHSGMLVNLGIGIPTLVANYLPKDVNVFFQSENRLIGTGPIPEEGMTHIAHLTTEQAAAFIFVMRRLCNEASSLAAL